MHCTQAFQEQHNPQETLHPNPTQPLGRLNTATGHLQGSPCKTAAPPPQPCNPATAHAPHNTELHHLQQHIHIPQAFECCQVTNHPRSHIRQPQPCQFRQLLQALKIRMRLQLPPQLQLL